ncbi:MAG: hypothetical protein LBH00_04275, partial [Planctomycetaceae bacterium]|nr:hypothetical protein [Planctomycetaceae bacterium]
MMLLAANHAAFAQGLTWTGKTGNIWDNSSSAINWNDGTDTSYVSGRNVSFDSSGSNKDILLNADVSAGTLTVQNTGYTFNLNGHSLTGTGIMQFQNSAFIASKDSSIIGNVEITGTNTFTFNMTAGLTNGDSILTFGGTLTTGVSGSSTLRIAEVDNLSAGLTIALLTVNNPSLPAQFFDPTSPTNFSTNSTANPAFTSYTW